MREIQITRVYSSEKNKETDVIRFEYYYIKTIWKGTKDFIEDEERMYTKQALDFYLSQLKHTYPESVEKIMDYSMVLL